MTDDDPREGSESAFRAELGLLRYRPLEWLLLGGNRALVSALLLAVVGAILAAGVLTGAMPLAERDPMLFILFALVSGNFTLITIVVSISQFVLSRHLESPGEIRERMRETVDFRADVAELTEEQVLPVTPSGFLLLLFRSVARDARTLRDADLAPDERTPTEAETAVASVMADLAAHAEYVVDLLERRESGTRYALFASLNTDYSRYFYEIYRLRAAFGDDLPDDAAGTLRRLERHVEQIDVARRYFKTVFIQSELSSLTRLLLYIGPPVQIASVVLMLLFTAADGPFVAGPFLAVAIPAVVTAGFAPFALLTAYILRLTTVVKRTAAMYPFADRDHR